ncbi:MAG: cytochrome P450, partial [Actinomycetota bacterium]
MTDTAENSTAENSTAENSTANSAENSAAADGLPIIGPSPEGTDLWERVPYNPDDYGDVDDWATDFDQANPEYNPNAPEIWKQLREGGCPVAHSDRYGGMWVPVTHETVHEVAYDTDNFSSRQVVVSHLRPGEFSLPAPIGVAPPITSDPPFHNVARRILLPPFAPKKIAALEPEVRELCNGLLDGLGDLEPGQSVVDAAVQYAQHIPIRV